MKKIDWITFSLLMMLGVSALLFGGMLMIPSPHTRIWNLIGAEYIVLGIISIVFAFVVVRMAGKK